MKNLLQCLFFLFLILLSASQNINQVKKQEIDLGGLYNITLDKGETKIYTVTIKNLKLDESLFVETISPTYDPFEIPSVIIKSEGNFSRYCTEQVNEFLGICEVEYQKLKESKKFDIEIKCTEKCNLQLQTFLSETLQLDFGKKIQIYSQKTVDTLKEFKIQVPLNLNFTDIALIATFLNQDSIGEGAQMYVNIGNDSKKIPTPQDYMYKGRQVWGDGIGVFISGKDIKAGQWMTVLIVLGKGVELQFYSQAANGKTFNILLNTAYKDFTTQDETKTYVLDLYGNSSSLGAFNMQNITVEIIFVIFSGVPGIKVGFQPTLKNSLQNYDIQGTFSYLITPEMRKKYNFTGRIYIQVHSWWVSNFYINTLTMSSKYFKMIDGLSQLNRAQPNQIHNYIYQSYIIVNTNQSDKQSYRLKIEIMEGSADVGIRRCLSLEKNKTMDCLIKNVSQLEDEGVKKEFDQLNISIRKEWDTYELLFEYNASSCMLYKDFTDFKIFNCDFQIIIFPAPSSNKTLVYSVTIIQDIQQAQLKQSYSYKDYISSNSYHYYQFNLPTIQNIQQVTFFMTVINGDAGLMGTTNEKFRFMEFADAIVEKDVIYSFYNSLTFKKEQLAKTFYLAIFAYELTDVTVSVIVKRTEVVGGNGTDNKSTSITKLTLLEGLTQQYTLNKGSSLIDFAFTSNNAKNITIQLIQIQGTVSFYIQKQGTTTNENVTCSNIPQAGELKCIFLAAQLGKYIIHVNGAVSEVESFSISYYYMSGCKKYPLNLPQFVFLPAGQSQCSNYSIIDKQKSLQIITSLSTLDLLTADIKFTITFNDNHSIQFIGRSKTITIDELKQFCKTTNITNCNLKVEYKGDQDISMKFNFVVEQVGKEMVLFDGIVRKVVDEKMTQMKGKFFYFEVTSMNDSVKIFTTNKDNVGYYVGAKFVQMSQFIASPDSLYLPYRGDLSKKLQNTYQTHLQSQKGTSMIQIDSDQFSKNCSRCVILISVYGLHKQSNQANIFDIEVTQTQSFIYLGQQQMGFLSEDEIYMYDIYGNGDAQSLLTIRDLMKQSGKQRDCFTASILQVGTTTPTRITNGYFIIPKTITNYRIFIQNTFEGICAYQISLSSLIKPITEITPYMPIQVKITNNQVRYYLYNHGESLQFQILSYVKSGDVKIFASRVDGNQSIENLLNKNLASYEFASHTGDSYLQVSNTSKFFKSNSYYLIAVKGDPNVISQLAINKGTQPIGLTTYGILKQTLNQKQKQTYVYYSIFDFNISIPLLFGQLKVTIITPDNKVLFNQTINKSIEIFIPKPITAQGQYIDYYDQNSLFTIIISAIHNSSYYISVKRKNVSLRVYEGIPITLELDNNIRTIEFVNVNDMGENVSMIMQVKQNVTNDFVIVVSAEVMKQGEFSSTKIADPIIKRSQQSWNYMFQSIKGTYFISMNTSTNVSVSMILVKKKLTHLMSSNANLFTEKGVFEIYTPGNNLMIVVDSCLGQVQVKASEKYDAIAVQGTTPSSPTSTPVLLQHANYGGHYIITAQHVSGEYFVQVNSKKPSDKMLYIISYYYYSKQDDMPYKKVDIDPQIDYQLTTDRIIFELSPVRQLESKMRFKIMPTYTLYISTDSTVSTMNSRCDLGVGFSYSQTVTPNTTTDSNTSQQSIKFPIQLKTLSQAIGENTEIYYVSAKVKVRIQLQNTVSDYIPYIDLAYSKLQLTQSTHTIEFKSQTTSNVKYILLWIVVPVIIAVILFILALKFCIKKYKMLYPDKLVEQDRQMGESENQMQNQTPKNADVLTNN